mgnify:CR=1 FL=1
MDIRSIQKSSHACKRRNSRNFKDDPTFGNARGVRNFFDRVVMNQSARILEIPNPTEMEFRTIRKEDIMYRY